MPAGGIQYPFSFETLWMQSSAQADAATEQDDSDDGFSSGFKPTDVVVQQVNTDEGSTSTVPPTVPPPKPETKLKRKKKKSNVKIPGPGQKINPRSFLYESGDERHAFNADSMSDEIRLDAMFQRYAVDEESEEEPSRLGSIPSKQNSIGEESVESSTFFLDKVVDIMKAISGDRADPIGVKFSHDYDGLSKIESDDSETEDPIRRDPSFTMTANSMILEGVSSSEVHCAEDSDGKVDAEEVHADYDSDDVIDEVDEEEEEEAVVVARKTIEPDEASSSGSDDDSKDDDNDANDSILTQSENDEGQEVMHGTVKSHGISPRASFRMPISPRNQQHSGQDAPTQELHQRVASSQVDSASDNSDEYTSNDEARPLPGKVKTMMRRGPRMAKNGLVKNFNKFAQKPPRSLRSKVVEPETSDVDKQRGVDFPKADLSMNSGPVENKEPKPYEISDLLEKRMWKELAARVRKEPEIASRVVNVESAVLSMRSDGNLLLHEVCKNEPSEEVVKELLWANRNSATVKGQWDYLPLHYACTSAASVEVVDHLIQAYPDAVKSRDCNDLMLPLHLACKWGTSKHTLAVLLNSYPEATLVRDIYGKIPMDYAMDIISPEMKRETIDCLRWGLRMAEDSKAESIARTGTGMEEVAGGGEVVYVEGRRKRSIHLQQEMSDEMSLDVALDEAINGEAERGADSSPEETSQADSDESDESSYTESLHRAEKQKRSILDLEHNMFKAMQYAQIDQRKALQTKILALEENQVLQQEIIQSLEQELEDAERELSDALVDQELHYTKLLVEEQRAVDEVKIKMHETEETHVRYVKALFETHKEEIDEFQEQIEKCQEVESKLRSQIQDEIERREEMEEQQRHKEHEFLHLEMRLRHELWEEICNREKDASKSVNDEEQVLALQEKTAYLEKALLEERAAVDRLQKTENVARHELEEERETVENLEQIKMEMKSKLVNVENMMKVLEHARSHTVSLLEVQKKRVEELEQGEEQRQTELEFEKKKAKAVQKTQGRKQAVLDSLQKRVHSLEKSQVESDGLVADLQRKLVSADGVRLHVLDLLDELNITESVKHQIKDTLSGSFNVVDAPLADNARMDPQQHEPAGSNEADRKKLTVMNKLLQDNRWALDAEHSKVEGLEQERSKLQHMLDEKERKLSEVLSRKQEHDDEGDGEMLEEKSNVDEPTTSASQPIVYDVETEEPTIISVVEEATIAREEIVFKGLTNMKLESIDEEDTNTRQMQELEDALEKTRTELGAKIDFLTRAQDSRIDLDSHFTDNDGTDREESEEIFEYAEHGEYEEREEIEEREHRDDVDDHGYPEAVSTETTLKSLDAEISTHVSDSRKRVHFDQTANNANEDALRSIGLGLFKYKATKDKQDEEESAYIKLDGQTKHHKNTVMYTPPAEEDYIFSGAAGSLPTDAAEQRMLNETADLILESM